MSKNRWAVVAVAACFIVTVAAVAYAAGKAKAAPKVVRAQRFELVDAKGRTRGEFGLIAAVGFPEDPSLSLFDEKGRGRAFLGLGPDGSPCLSLYDEKGKERAALGATKEKRTESSLVLFDREGKVMWQAP